MSTPTPDLPWFSAPTREWFRGAFEAPTVAQSQAWESISGGQNSLVVAPTGSGKTLAAFLWALDRIATSPAPERQHRCRVLYVSPLKALAVDVQRNLRAPLTGITHTADRLGLDVPDIAVGTRTGDTPARERRRFVTHPPDVLITTPESLFLLLTSQARQSLRGVDTVIVDEIHSVAGTKRGAHLALSLERLDELLPRPAQRIGLSATVRPVEEVARFLGGSRPVTVVAPASPKRLEVDVVVPVEDMTALPGPGPDDPGGADSDPQRRASLWPHVEERVADLVEKHRSTICFVNSRRVAERLTARLNEIAAARHGATADDPPPCGPTSGPPAQVMAQSGASHGAAGLLARAHHGSVSKSQRAAIEDDLKAGRLPCVVATSSLELGIDMGTVDLVVQVAAPPSIASGLQRVGRAGHHVDEVSRGVLFPQHRGDLVPTAVVVERMRAGRIEALHLPANPLDVLAQQVIAATATATWDVDALFALVRRAAPFASLPRSAFDATLDLLAGRYPSDEFAELRPRVVWDRVTGTVTARPGAGRLAVTSGGTIPDRGLFGVFLVGETTAAGHARPGARVGELDEEMVYESRVGDVFALGTSSWRIEDITHDRVLVSPAPGQPGRLPFWKGEAPGRPAELGAAIGAYVREVGALPAAEAERRVRESGLDEYAAANLVRYLAEQREDTGSLPHDRQIVVERCRDELGDWRVVVHSPYGKAVHGPWALAIGARLREQFGVDAQAMAADDGIVVRVPDTDADPPGAAACVLSADEVEDVVSAEVGQSTLFASRFRECAARALLLPRRNPGKRSPLWQQRQRSAALLEVASKYGSFPIVLEAVRECLHDVYDVPGLTALMQEIAARRVRVVEVETPAPSAFARSLLFGYVADFIYEGDSPLAERRAAALALDPTLLGELLGRVGLRDLLDPEVVETTEAELQRLADDRRVRDAEGVADLLRWLGPLSAQEVAVRCRAPASARGWSEQLVESRRAVWVRVAAADRLAAVEDVGRLRDALGVPVPAGVAAAFTEPVADPLADLVSRYARTHGPFTAQDVAARLGTGRAVVTDTLTRLAADGRVVSGEFRPGGHGPEWCDAGVLRRLRRRSLAAARQEVEPVDQGALGRFLPAWHAVGGRLRGPEGVLAVVDQLDGMPVPASALEPLVLRSRVADYAPGMLDELTAAGEVVWAGCGSMPGTDGWVSLHPAATAPLTLAEPEGLEQTETHRALLEQLHGGGAWFFRQLSDAVGNEEDTVVAAALWDLVWAGLVTNDTLQALRTWLHGGTTAHRSRRGPPRGRYRGRPVLPSRTGPPTVSGRWSLLPPRESDPTLRATAVADVLLERHGIVTRGVTATERLSGGFAGLYAVLSRFEEAGRCRRGYFVAGLGAAQFGTTGAVDRLRSFTDVPDLDDSGAPATVVLAATDPANPYGAALAWPQRPTDSAGAGHRPGRKAGAVVILVEGALALYVERGGRSLLTFSDDHRVLDAAVGALAVAVREGALGRVTVTRADGDRILGSPLADALEAAGFRAGPQGLRLRPDIR